MEEEQKKKLQLKDKKLSEMEQKYSDLKDEQIRIKTQNEIHVEKLSNNLSTKVK